MIDALLTWLGFGRKPVRVGLRPRRDVLLDLGSDAARARVRHAMETVLGANVYADGPDATIEAGFGLVNNERVRATLEALAGDSTRVRIEALFPAGAAIPERSPAVDALAQALSSPVTSP